MKTIQNIFGFFTVLIIFLMIMIIPARAAVVANIADTEFDSLISTHAAAWAVMYRGGSTGTGTGVEEIRLARNIAIPQANGGTDTLIGNLTWSASNNVLEILLDGAGNVSARANAATVGTLPVIQTFNQILVRVFDNSAFGSSDLQNIEINAAPVRNMFADGDGPTVSNDIVSITDFGSLSPFSLNGAWSPGIGPNSNDQYVWVVALNNVTIPEPSTILLTGFSSLLLLRRKR